MPGADVPVPVEPGAVPVPDVPGLVVPGRLRVPGAVPVAPGVPRLLGAVMAPREEPAVPCAPGLPGTPAELLTPGLLMVLAGGMVLGEFVCGTGGGGVGCVGVV